MTEYNVHVPVERLGTSRLNHIFLKIVLYDPTSEFQGYEIDRLGKW